jgi:hypothetical protein
LFPHLYFLHNSRQLDPSNKGARKAFEAVKSKIKGKDGTTVVASETGVDDLDAMMGRIKSVRNNAAALGDKGRRDAAANAAMELWEMIGDDDSGSSDDDGVRS